MTSHQTKLNKAYSLIFLTFIVAYYFISGDVSGTSWSLLPPAVAIFMAFLTGSLGISLGAAVLVGSFIVVYGKTLQLGSSITGTVYQTGNYFFQAGSDKTNLQILGFVFFILSMVHVMTASGGLFALVKSLQRWVVGRKSAQFVTFLLGCVIFIDDYANTMIVGSTMKKVTDRYKISREKLAFLVDATSAPIAGVALVSTWIGYEVGLFSEMSKKFAWEIDGYGIFLDAIQFRFYCFLMLFFVFVNILTGVDFGPMKKFEESPILEEEWDDDEPEASILCSIFPLGLLIFMVFGLLWHDGGGFSPELSLLSLTDWRQVLTSSQNGIFILLISAMTSFGVALLLSIPLSKQPFSKMLESVYLGAKSAILPVTILILAWSLKEVCSDMKSGEYIVSLLGDQVGMSWLPLSIFIVAALTAFATGTSWGTMAILIPTVTPLAVAVSGEGYGVFVSLCLAAILDGAIMGDHCSPISDTTIMSSISTDCDLMNHVRTQLPYSLIVGLIAVFFGYLPAGLQISPMITFPIALGIIVVLFVSLKIWPRFMRETYD